MPAEGEEFMTTMGRIVSSLIVGGVFAAGCVAGEPSATPVAQTEQELGTLGGTTQAQERLITYYSEPELINIVGSCFGPYACYGPKGTHCTGIKTRYYEIE